MGVLTIEQQKALVKTTTSYEGMMQVISDGVEGALPNGTKVMKINSEPGDIHKDGKEGVVKGSLYVGHIEAPKEMPDRFKDVQYMYIVDFTGNLSDEELWVGALIMDKKIQTI